VIARHARGRGFAENPSQRAINPTSRQRTCAGTFATCDAYRARRSPEPAATAPRSEAEAKRAVWRRLGDSCTGGETSFAERSLREPLRRAAFA
jgi:hypothetical protein